MKTCSVLVTSSSLGISFCQTFDIGIQHSPMKLTFKSCMVAVRGTLSICSISQSGQWRTIGIHKTGVQTWRVCCVGSRAYTLPIAQNVGSHAIWAGVAKQRNCQVLSRLSCTCPLVPLNMFRPTRPLSSHLLGAPRKLPFCKSPF